MIKDLIKNIFNVDYDTFFKNVVDEVLGPTGAEIAAWICLIIATFLIMRRRVSSIGVIVMLYILAFILAYAPSIYKIIKGVS